MHADLHAVRAIVPEHKERLYQPFSFVGSQGFGKLPCFLPFFLPYLREARIQRPRAQAVSHGLGMVALRLQGSCAIAVQDSSVDRAPRLSASQQGSCILSHCLGKLAGLHSTAHAPAHQKHWRPDALPAWSLPNFPTIDGCAHTPGARDLEMALSQTQAYTCADAGEEGSRLIAPAQSNRAVVDNASAWRTLKCTSDFLAQ